VSRWLNRFVSPGLLVLLTACQSAQPSGAQASGAGTGPTAVATQAPAPAAAATQTPAPAGQHPGSVPAAAVSADVPVPPRAAAQYADALALMKSGKTVDAELALKQLNASYPEYSGPEVNLGLIYLQAARLPEAEAAFKDAIVRNPASATAGNELGIVERRLGKFSEAEASYQRTLAAQPDYAPAILNLGVLYDLYLSQPQKALEQFERYLQLTGENKQVSGWVVELRKRVGAAGTPGGGHPPAGAPGAAPVNPTPSASQESS
jgi:tetratricopeptide (TPR) repeat protein